MNMNVVSSTFVVYGENGIWGNMAKKANFTVLFSPLSDAISSANPRVIEDTRARKLSNDLKRCTYYETCATYGLNVERVFQDGKRQ